MDTPTNTEIIVQPLSKEEQELSDALVVKDVEYARKLVEDARRYQYQLVSDPLFFGWQRGDNTEAEWLAAVDKIKADYPYPEVAN